MNKDHVIEHLRFALDAQLATAKIAAKTAHDTATHEESIPENKYDTLGLEAAYLAQGYSQRVNECYNDVQLFNSAFKHKIQGVVQVGALVCVTWDKVPHKWFYIGPAAGGLTVELHDVTVQVITPSAPLGKQLLNKQCYDEIILTVAGVKHHYEIIEIL